MSAFGRSGCDGRPTKRLLSRLPSKSGLATIGPFDLGDAGQKSGCSPSEANLRDRKGKPAFS